MKFKVTMKDPDTLGDAERNAVMKELKNIPDIDADEREALVENRCEKLREITRKWFEYGEYLTVEIDTDAGTATVCAVKP